VSLLDFDSKSTLSSFSRSRSTKRRRHEEPSSSVRRALRRSGALQRIAMALHVLFEALHRSGGEDESVQLIEGDVRHLGDRPPAYAPP